MHCDSQSLQDETKASESDIGPTRPDHIKQAPVVHKVHPQWAGGVFRQDLGPPAPPYYWKFRELAKTREPESKT